MRDLRYVTNELVAVAVPYNAFLGPSASSQAIKVKVFVGLRTASDGTPVDPSPVVHMRTIQHLL